MDDKRVMLRMLRALLNDVQNIQQRGAGYYTNAPFVDRYNSMLETAKKILAGQSHFLDTFVPLEDTRSVDPADKMKVTQRVVVELGQLIALVEECLAEGMGPELKAQK